MKFKKSFIMTEITFGYIKQNMIVKGGEIFPRKVSLERVRAGLKKKYGMLIEPKVEYIMKEYELDTKNGKTVKKGI